MDEFYDTYSWWTFVLGGLLSIIFGGIFFFAPTLVIAILVFVIGLFLIVGGIASIIKGATVKVRSSGSVLYLIAGFVEVLIGVAAFAAPEFFASILVYIIAFWAFLLGMSEIVVALTTPELGWGRALFLLGGILALIFALIMVVNPLLAGVALIQVIGIFSFAWGIVSIVEGVIVRGHQEPGHGKSGSPA
jgi:uncharacterized membrane protein HdeD (DUF308 family)